MTGASCPTPAGPVPLDSVAQEMFALARELRAAATTPRGEGELDLVRPEAVGRIATALGRLAQAQARADQAYAEGARQATRAGGEAQRQSAVPGVTLSMPRAWNITSRHGDVPDRAVVITLRSDDECRALEDLLTAARFRGGLTLGLAESKGEVK